MTDPLSLIQQGRVDGVPVFSTPGGGAVSCGLSFRVGIADEALDRRGITHLVEHLALLDLHTVEHAYNGSVSLLFTTFTATGTPEEVKSFLETVCATLHDLPFARLDAVRKVLRREGDDHTAVGNEGALTGHYGMASAGLASVPEHAIDLVSEDELRQWVERYFTKANASLWLTGAVPDGLTLDLPDGAPMPVPAAVPVEQTTPAFIEVPLDGFAVSLRVANEGYATGLMASVLRERMMQLLRHEHSLTYDVDVQFQGVDDENGVLVIGCSTEPEASGVALRHAVECLDEMAAGGIDERDLRKARRGFEEFLSNPSAGEALVADMAKDRLIGKSDLEAEIERVRQITPAEMAAALAAALPTAIAASDYLPDEIAARFTDSSFSEGPPVSGREVKTRWTAFGMKARLLVGEEGLSYMPDDAGGRHTTLRYDEIVACEVHDDGDRILIGRDGRRIALLAGAWRKSHRLFSDVETRLHAAARVPVFFEDAPSATEGALLAHDEETDGELIAAARGNIRPHWLWPLVAFAGFLTVAAGLLLAAAVTGSGDLGFVGVLALVLGVATAVIHRPFAMYRLRNAPPRKMVAKAFLLTEHTRRAIAAIITLHDPDVDRGAPPVTSVMTSATFARGFTAKRQPVLVFAVPNRKAVAVASLADGRLLGLAYKAMDGVVESVTTSRFPIPGTDEDYSVVGSTGIKWTASGLALIVLAGIAIATDGVVEGLVAGALGAALFVIGLRKRRH